MSKKVLLPDKQQCTGCGVCETVCPVNSIRMQADVLDCRYPVIDPTTCLQCGACMRHCHALSEKQANMPRSAWAAWNTSEKERATSASGGIASAIYSYALEHDAATYGVRYQVGKSAKYIPICCAKDIAACKNSKYVSSECIGAFPDIKSQLTGGRNVIFIGLPCHVAALKAYLGKAYDNLLLVDIICHGVAPVEYLNQHIRAVEKKKKRSAEALFFRDPKYGTEKFFMTLLNGAERFYCAAPRGGDAYSTGYHCALTYRENCYHCQYATADRVSDITIGDFSGLGKFAPWEGSKVGISCLLASTEKGNAFVDRLVKESRIYCQERPLDEALKVEKQLMHPSVPHKNREAFKRKYAQHHDFEKATGGLLLEDAIHSRVATAKRALRGTVSRLVPGRLKAACRSFINKFR